MNDFDGPRPARPDEIDDVLVLANAVMREGRAPTIGTDYPFIYNNVNAGNVIIVRDGERVVSMTGTWMNTVQALDAQIRAGGINCVATLPGYRGQGLATRVMHMAMEHLAAFGCHVGRLTTGINDWYYRMGWENAGSIYIYRLNHSNIGLLPALPSGTTVTDGTEFSDDVISAILRLRQADRLGGQRTPDILRALLAADNDPSLMGSKRYVMAHRDGAPVAYCLDTVHGIVEWGGEGELVAGLIREWFGQRVGERGGQLPVDSQAKVAQSRELTVVAPKVGHSFAGLLGDRGISANHEYWGMLNIIDPRGILDAFGLQSIELREHDGLFTLSRDSTGKAESVTVTRQALAKLLFGPEKISDFPSELLPLLFWEWPLEHV